MFHRTLKILSILEIQYTAISVCMTENKYVKRSSLVSWKRFSDWCNHTKSWQQWLVSSNLLTAYWKKKKMSRNLQGEGRYHHPAWLYMINLPAWSCHFCPDLQLVICCLHNQLSQKPEPFTGNPNSWIWEIFPLCTTLVCSLWCDFQALCPTCPAALSVAGVLHCLNQDKNFEMQTKIKTKPV